MFRRELTLGRTWLMRLDTDVPLYEQMLSAATDLGVQAATLTVFGAVGSASLRTYDQERKEYADFTIERPLELVSGIGNVSLRDGRPFLHCHVTLAEEGGAAYGGHLHETLPTPVFVGEVWLQELLGEPPVRLLDERCGLALWPTNPGAPGA